MGNTSSSSEEDRFEEEDSILELSSKAVTTIYRYDKGLNRVVLMQKEKRLSLEVFSKAIQQNMGINRMRKEAKGKEKPTMLP